MLSLAGDVKEGFAKLTEMSEMHGIGDYLQGIWNGIKNVGSGFLQGLIGNLLGGNIGVAGEGQAVPALLSGAPSGFWHVTVGNPLDPIAMMGNMAVTNTRVEFSDALGYDDFPTEIKFTVKLEHCMPRDNASMENMFNGAKGRFYSFTNGDILNAYHSINSLDNFITSDDNLRNQEINKEFPKDAQPVDSPAVHDQPGRKTSHAISVIGRFLNG
jgi:hypothetical protein